MPLAPWLHRNLQKAEKTMADSENARDIRRHVAEDECRRDLLSPSSPGGRASSTSVADRK